MDIQEQLNNLSELLEKNIEQTKAYHDALSGIEDSKKITEEELKELKGVVNGAKNDFKGVLSDATGVFRESIAETMESVPKTLKIDIDDAKIAQINRIPLAIEKGVNEMKNPLKTLMRLCLFLALFALLLFGISAYFGYRYFEQGVKSKEELRQELTQQLINENKVIVDDEEYTRLSDIELFIKTASKDKDLKEGTRDYYRSVLQHGEKFHQSMNAERAKQNEILNKK